MRVLTANEAEVSSRRIRRGRQSIFARKLERDYSMRVCVEYPFAVMYATGDVEVSVYYDVLRTGELDVFVRHVSDGPGIPGVGLSEMAVAFGQVLESPETALFPSATGELELEISSLAIRLQGRGHALLRNEADAWTAIKASRQRN